MMICEFCEKDYEKHPEFYAGSGPNRLRIVIVGYVDRLGFDGEWKTWGDPCPECLMKAIKEIAQLPL